MRRRLVQHFCTVVNEPQIIRRLVVKCLFAHRPLRQVVGKSVRRAAWIKWLAFKRHHFLLRAADKKPLPAFTRHRLERINGAEGLRVEQLPQREKRIIFAHVRRRRQQQQMPGAPAKIPFSLAIRHARQCLRQFITCRPSHCEVWVLPSRKFVRLVKDHEVVRHHTGFRQPQECPLAAQRVHGADDMVAVRAGGKGVAVSRREIRAGHDGKFHSKQFA